MPVLSIDHGKSHTTALLLNDDNTYKLAKISLSLPKINYGFRPSKEEYFRLLMKDIETRFKTKALGKYPVYVSHFQDLGVSIDGIKFCTKNDAFKSLYPLDFTYFGHLSVGSSTGIYQKDIDFNELVKELFFDEKPETIINYFENLNLYTYVEPDSDRDYYEEDTCLKFLVRKHCDYIKTNPLEEIRPVLFCTTKNLENESKLCRFMLLCVESVCTVGFYRFKLDFKNFIGTAAPISYFDNKKYQEIDVPEYFEMGSIVNIPDEISCSTLKDGEPFQQFKLSKNEIFTLPLTFQDKVDVVVKSKKYGELKKTLSGGAFGVVFDTREKSYDTVLPLEKRKVLMQEWEETLLIRLRGF